MKHSRSIGAVVGALSLGVLSVVGIGFGAWTITQAPQKTTGQLTLQADASVTDKRITIDATNSKFTDHTVYFGAPATMNTKGAWLTNDGTKNEDLSATYHLACTVADNKSALTVSASIEGNADFEKLVTAGYVAKPQASVPSSMTKDTNNIYSADITVTFGWGTHFDGKNPYTYYNAKKMMDPISTGSNTTCSDDAKKSLEALKDLNSITLTLQLTVSAN